MYDGTEGGLYSNLPASIQIEEMILGRLTFRQLIYVVLGATVSYQAYAIFDLRIITFVILALSAAAVYVLGFFRISKYNRHLTEHIYYRIMYKSRVQAYLPKNN